MSGVSSTGSSHGSGSHKPYDEMTVQELLEALQPFLRTKEIEEEEKLIKKLLENLGYKGFSFNP